MAFFEEDESFVEWQDDIEVPEIDTNLYIHDADKAALLISELLQQPKKVPKYLIGKIRSEIQELFHCYSHTTLENELLFYQSFMTLCSRLEERRRIQKLGNKTVIGIGGKFSAGKSKFLNSLSGLDGILPEETAPTTAIPTYIIKGTTTSYTANNIYGAECQLDREKLQAMTHEFFETYQIGFSSFIESVFIESAQCKLPTQLALLDTPGYNKFDVKTKEAVSDRKKAFDQLRISDYLIWLVDADNGTLTNDDIRFISELNLSEPILIVLNKCDKKTEQQINDILDQAVSDIQMSDIRCYGIVAYSSRECVEYGGRPLTSKKAYDNNMIQQFLQFTASSKRRNNDIVSQFHQLEERFLKSTRSNQNALYASSQELEKLIRQSESVMHICSIAKIWSENSNMSYQMYMLENKCKEHFENIFKMLDKYLKGENNE